MDGIIPALADLTFPRSATPWLTTFALSDDGNPVDTSSATARLDIATDATFSTLLLTLRTGSPTSNGSSLTLDSAGNGQLLISSTDSAAIPLNGIYPVAYPYRLSLGFGSISTPVVVGTLYADTF